MANEVVKLLRQVLDGQDAINKRLARIEAKDVNPDEGQFVSLPEAAKRLGRSAAPLRRRIRKAAEAMGETNQITMFDVYWRKVGERWMAYEPHLKRGWKGAQ